MNDEYIRKGGDNYQGNWVARAFKTTKGDWAVVEYSAIALNMAEAMGRFPTRVEATNLVDRIAQNKVRKC